MRSSVLKNLWTIQDWKTAYQNGQIHLKDLIGYVAELKMMIMHGLKLHRITRFRHKLMF
ncbi:amidase [Acinetobacter baumannii ABNIH10]|nr:amidase [Acinetobacter baumannii ABNIH10]